MSRFSTILSLLVCVAVFLSATVYSNSSTTEQGINSSIIFKAKYKNFFSTACGRNAHAVTSYSHEGCYDNCQNKDQIRPCLAILYHGHSCECDTGFVFQSGASGDCVEPQ